MENRFKQTAAYYLSFILLGSVFALLGPTINALADNAGVGLEAISVLFTAAALGYVIGSLISGPLYDRLHAHAFMAFGLIGTGAVLLIVPQATSLWLLVALELALGMVTAIIDVGGNALLVWAHDGHNLGPFMNALHVFFGVGAFLAPILVTTVLGMGGGMRAVYQVEAVVAVLVGLALLLVKGPARVRAPATAAAERVAGGARRHAPLLYIVLFLFFIVAAEGAMGGWIFNYAKGFGATDADSAKLTAAYWGAFTVGRFLGIPISARVRPAVILVVDVLLCLLSMAVLWFGHGALAANWIGAIVFGLGMASIFATMLGYAGSRMALTGSVAGLFLACGSMGSMLLPLLIGSLVVRSGPDMIPALLFIAMLGGLLSLLALFRTSRSAVPVVQPA